MKKWNSRKFILTIICYAIIVILKSFGLLNDNIFAALFGGLYVAYVFIQGRIDLEQLKTIKYGETEIEFKEALDVKKKEK